MAKNGLLLVAVLILGLWMNTNAGAQERAAGRFFLIGGNASSTLHDFARLAGGAEKGHIVVITYAADKPEESADSVQNVLSAADVRHTTVINVDSKAGQIPSDATAVYLVGGHESRLMRLLSDSVREQLAGFKGLIGGNSAGAMVIRGGDMKLAHGLGLIPRVMIDSHVGQRNRDARCAATLAAQADVDMCIGLDEDTAILVQGNRATVFGAGHVRLFRKGAGFGSEYQNARNNEVVSVNNVLVSYLSAGDQFDLP
jgi:cyanophycinase